MSRKGKEPIPLPKGVEVKVSDRMVTVKGPKGQLTQEVGPQVQFQIDSDKVLVSLKEGFEQFKNFHGLYWALVNNMVTGTSTGFEKKLQMIGVGYRASVKGKDLDLLVGLSHPCALPIPEGVEVNVDKNTMITISGSDKQVVGQFAATVRSKRPPEPYQGKGIRYVDEYVRKKAGKSAAKK